VKHQGYQGGAPWQRLIIVPGRKANNEFVRMAVRLALAGLLCMQASSGPASPAASALSARALLSLRPRSVALCCTGPARAATPSWREARADTLACPCTRRLGQRRWGCVPPTLRLRGGARVKRERKLESESERESADEESSVGTSSASSARVCQRGRAHGRHACACTRRREHAVTRTHLEGA